MPAIVLVNGKELEQLVNIVEERIADVDTSKLPARPVFSAADLWNIRRNRKYAFARRESTF